MFIQWERVLAPFMTNELYSIYILTFGCLDHHGMLIYIYKHTHIYRHKQPNTTHVYVYYMINEAKYMFQETNKQKQSKYCCLQKFFFFLILPSTKRKSWSIQMTLLTLVLTYECLLLLLFFWSHTYIWGSSNF